MAARVNTKQEILEVLTAGEIVSAILTPKGSNYTFLVGIDDGHGRITKAIYKPQKGEAPLWDFEHGTLFKREYASYLLSQSLGWDFIPETIEPTTAHHRIDFLVIHPLQSSITLT